jgi:hypothetical protein
MDVAREEYYLVGGARRDHLRMFRSRLRGRKVHEVTAVRGSWWLVAVSKPRHTSRPTGTLRPNSPL